MSEESEESCPECGCRTADMFRFELEHHAPGCRQTPVGALPALSDRFAEQARRVAIHWRDQQGINVRELDTLVELLTKADATSGDPLRGLTISNEIFERGCWQACTGCHESSEGYATGPYSAALRCHLGSGCHECGGLGAVWEPPPTPEQLAELDRQVDDLRSGSRTTK